MPTGNREACSGQSNREPPIAPDLVLVLASACGHAAGTGGSVGGAPGTGRARSSPARHGRPGFAPRRCTPESPPPARTHESAGGAYPVVPGCRLRGGPARLGNRGDPDADDAAPPDTACPEIAMLRKTRVSLGSLPSGSYTVHAGGRQAPLVRWRSVNRPVRAVAAARPAGTHRSPARRPRRTPHPARRRRNLDRRGAVHRRDAQEERQLRVGEALAAAFRQALAGSDHARQVAVLAKQLCAPSWRRSRGRRGSRRTGRRAAR